MRRGRGEEGGSGCDILGEGEALHIQLAKIEGPWDSKKHVIMRTIELVRESERLTPWTQILQCFPVMQRRVSSAAQSLVSGEASGIDMRKNEKK